MQRKLMIEHCSQVLLEEKAATRVRINMKGGGLVLKEIRATGICYGAKDILKMRVKEYYKQYFYMRTDINTILDNMDYQD